MYPLTELETGRGEEPSALATQTDELIESVKTLYATFVPVGSKVTFRLSPTGSGRVRAPDPSRFITTVVHGRGVDWDVAAGRSRTSRPRLDTEKPWTQLVPGTVVR